jgi:hypothetical protein
MPAQVLMRVRSAQMPRYRFTIFITHQTMINVAQAYERRTDQATKEERGAGIVSQAG